MNHDPEGGIFELQWVYTPSDFFEESVIWERGDYLVELGVGRVTARISAGFYNAHPHLQASLDAELTYYFEGTTLKRQKTFELIQGGSTRILRDGRRHITITPEPGLHTVTSSVLDVRITRANGTVEDPRRERIAETQRLGELATRVAPTDTTAQKLLAFYQAALRDPDKELVHLYDIWEGIVKAFGGRRAAAKQTLGIEEGRLSRLANNEPLKQGRHSGQHLHNLRDATRQELQEAHDIAVDMLIRYLDYKDIQPDKRRAPYERPLR
jgi:hypothetical protein